MAGELVDFRNMTKEQLKEAADKARAVPTTNDAGVHVDSNGNPHFTDEKQAAIDAETIRALTKKT